MRRRSTSQSVSTALRAPRRIRNLLAALLAGVSAAALPAVIAPSQAFADDPPICWYQDDRYSIGSVVIVHGWRYQCMADNFYGASWQETGPFHDYYDY